MFKNRLRGSRFRVQRFKVQGSRLKAQGSGFRVQGSGFKGSRFSAAAGLKSGQSNRKKTLKSE